MPNNVRLSENNNLQRFIRSEIYQVISKERMTRRCYWEVEFGNADPSVAVFYKNNVSPSLREFGCNDTSWELSYSNYYGNYRIRHNNRETSVHGIKTKKIGVYVDHKAGILAFYNENMKLIHQVQTKFTEPLYAGISLRHSYYNTYSKATAQFLSKLT